MFTLLNTSIVTSYGTFTYQPKTLEEILRLIAPLECGCHDPRVCQYCGGTGTMKETFVNSAIGHQATADILTELLGIEVKVNRVNYQQKKGDKAIVFKLKQRIEEGQILDRKAIEKIGYEFGLLEKTSN